MKRKDRLRNHKIVKKMNSQGFEIEDVKPSSDGGYEVRRDDETSELLKRLKYKFQIDGPKEQTIEGHVFRRLDSKETTTVAGAEFFTVPIPKGYRGHGSMMVLQYMGVEYPELNALRRQMDELETQPPSRAKVEKAKSIREELRKIAESNAEELKELDFKRDTIEWYLKWLEGGGRLEKNDCSRLHQLVESMHDRRVVTFKEELMEENAVSAMLVPFLMAPTEEDKRQTGVFVVQHAWSSLIEDPGDPVRIPFPISVFEFRVSNATVIFVAATKEGDDEGEPTTCAFVQTPGGVWLTVGASIDGAKYDSEVHDRMWKEVRAICISLEVNVLTHAVVRAPSALNQKRERSGKTPLRDYHLLNLARRYRVTNPSGGHVPGHHKRLHLRRGHWRHYPDHKTWIKWTLAGDPALGFVEKDYAL